MEQNFFDQAYDAGKRAWRFTCDKTEEAVDFARVKFRAAELKSSIREKERLLGSLASDQMELGRMAFSDEMQAVFHKIEQLKQELEALEEND